MSLVPASGDHWPCDWLIVPGTQPGTYRIKTCGHADGEQPAGWGLSAWHAHGAERNGESSWVHVHAGEYTLTSRWHAPPA